MATILASPEFKPLTTTREERGREIAKRGGIRQLGSRYVVPSQSQSANTTAPPSYLVDLVEQTCTCPDHAERGALGIRCKHIEAALFYVAWDGAVSDGGALGAAKPKRRTYPRNWPAYTGKSGRAAEAEIRTCEKLGYITKSFQHNKIHSAMEDEALTAILEWLIEESAGPLAAVENLAGQFSQDSSGFSTEIYGRRWVEHKHGAKRAETTPDDDVEPRLEDTNGRRKFMKLHATTGALTHVVTCAKVSSEGDCKRLPEQLQRTAQRFQVKEFSADKAYLTRENVNAIAAIGARPLIPFKCNSINHPDDRAWSDMWAHFQLRREDFLDRYHRRSNCETAMAMIKAKFGGFVRSRLPVAMTNEIYCKVIAHNLACIVLAIAEFGIETPFSRVEHEDAVDSSENTVVTLTLVKP